MTTVNPQPLFDTLENISSTSEHVLSYLKALPVPSAEKEFHLCLEFLKSYGNSKDTFTAYRREVERVVKRLEENQHGFSISERDFDA